MKRFEVLFFLMLGFTVPGCGGRANGTTEALATGPLTLEEWKALPVERKYEPETFERLKKADKQLQSSSGWDRFLKTVIIPHRQKEIPGPWGTYKNKG
jgi:hypothetical protein